MIPFENIFQISICTLAVTLVSTSTLSPAGSLKKVFRMYESVQTIDPFLWQASFDSLLSDAKLSRSGDPEALERFRNRLCELLR